jgi:hypothetical protein
VHHSGYGATLILHKKRVVLIIFDLKSAVGSDTIRPASSGVQQCRDRGLNSYLDTFSLYVGLGSFKFRIAV